MNRNQTYSWLELKDRSNYPTFLSTLSGIYHKPPRLVPVARIQWQARCCPSKAAKDWLISPTETPPVPTGACSLYLFPISAGDRSLCTGWRDGQSLRLWSTPAEPAACPENSRSSNDRDRSTYTGNSCASQVWTNAPHSAIQFIFPPSGWSKSAAIDKEVLSGSKR